MPAITNTTLKTEVARIAKTLVERGENWSAEHSATVIVRTILTELGCKDEMSDEMRDERKALVDVIKPLMTASKNFQTSYIASTNGDDGKPLMPPAKTIAQEVKAEFV